MVSFLFFLARDKLNGLLALTVTSQASKTSVSLKVKRTLGPERPWQVGFFSLAIHWSELLHFSGSFMLCRIQRRCNQIKQATNSPLYRSYYSPLCKERESMKEGKRAEERRGHHVSSFSRDHSPNNTEIYVWTLGKCQTCSTGYKYLRGFIRVLFWICLRVKINIKCSEWQQITVI